MKNLRVVFVGLVCFLISPVVRAQPSQATRSTQPPEASYSGIADPAAVVTSGHARFTVLTPQLIRMEWSADGKFEDRPSLVFINRRLPVPKFEHKEFGHRLLIDTGALRVNYNPDAPQNGRLSDDSLLVNLTVNGKTIGWRPSLPNDGNLLGTTRTLDGAKGDKTKEPIEPGLVSREGWVLVDDSARPVFDSDNFNFSQGEQAPWPWVTKRAEGDRQDWYFLGYGHDYKKALGDFVQVAGRIPIPPRFAFGIWWSRYWAYSDQELDDLVSGFQESDVPLDVLVIDMDWHLNRHQLEAMNEKDQSNHTLGWSGYTWNPLLFPDPKGFLDHIHDEGLKATLNLHPASGVHPWEQAYPAMAKAMGVDPASHKYVPFDITNKQFATNYMDLLHHPLEKQGIDFWWLDWQQETKTNTPGVNPTWWLNYVHFTDQEREGKRPLLFHRWGGLGNHRYQIGFSGDTISTWDSLAFQPWFTATAANVGYAYWSHDIGGHMPGIVAPELYTRWIEFGAYSPILRTHTTKNPDSERRIWAYPEPYAGIMRDAMQKREALEPYVYTEARHTYDTGVAFLHPLYYDWPEADAAYYRKDEYVFGSEMLVAPVTKPVDENTQLASQEVWIPEGEWIESETGKHFTGPTPVTRKFLIDETPVYVKAGAIVPMQPPMGHIDEKPLDPLVLEVYPLVDQQASEYSLYADSSNGETYKRGAYTWTKISAKQTGDELAIQVAPVEGSYPGMITERSYEVRLPGDWPPDSVSVNGAKLTFTDKETAKVGWRFEGNTLTTVIRTAKYPVRTAVRIDVHRAKGSVASRNQLDGFAGAIHRLRSAYDTLNSLLDLKVSAPDPLIDAWQTGDRLTYHPEKAHAEIDRFVKIYDTAMQQVGQLASSGAPEEISDRMHKSDADQERIRNFSAYIHRAQAVLEDGKAK